MKYWVWMIALQIVALAVIANRLSQDGATFLQSWTKQSSQHCGLLDADEYVITSHNVVLPGGIAPAAGEL